MKYFLTKYSLSHHGEVIEVETSKEPSDGRIFLKPEAWAFGASFSIGKEVFENPADAKAAVLKARDRKIASLETQIAKLRKII